MIPASVRSGAAVKEEKYLELARPLAPDELAALARKAPQQAKLCVLLGQQFKPQKKSLLLARLGLTAAVATALVKRGIAREVCTPRRARCLRRRLGGRRAGRHTAAHAQRGAGRRHCRSWGQSHGETVRDPPAARGYRLGEDRGLSSRDPAGARRRRRSDFLVPEVALTPQTVARLRGRLEIAGGHKTVVWHSHLSEGERLDGWLALATGEARVVVGARSAVFAPVQNLRLIVVDEEHEPAYKQDETPRYHGRDVAVVPRDAQPRRLPARLGHAVARVVVNVRDGKYRLNRLTSGWTTRSCRTLTLWTCASR